MAWTNKDGLVVWFGTERAETQQGGLTSAKPKNLVHKFTFSDVADTDTAAAEVDAPFIPAGAFISRDRRS